MRVLNLCETGHRWGSALRLVFALDESRFSSIATVAPTDSDITLMWITIDYLWVLGENIVLRMSVFR